MSELRWPMASSSCFSSDPGAKFSSLATASGPPLSVISSVSVRSVLLLSPVSTSASISGEILSIRATR